MQETWVRFLGWEDTLETEMAIHSSTLAWKIPWTEEPGGLQSMGVTRIRHNLATKLPPPPEVGADVQESSREVLPAVHIRSGGFVGVGGLD